MASFTLTIATNDNFFGLPGQNNLFLFTSATLQATDVVTGGATGAFIDILRLTAAGTVTAAQFAGVTFIEELELPSAGAAVTLANGLVAGSSLSGSRFIVDGDAGVDTIDGSGINNGKVLVLSGLGNNDTLTGGSAADILDGGTGVDTMTGGDGDDTYHVDSEADIVVESAGQGIDTVHATVAYTLSANVDHLTLVEGAAAAVNGAGNGDLNIITGNSLDNALSGMGGDDVLIGGGGHDILVGGSGDDTMAGGIGNDTYYVDSEADTVAEAFNAGQDTVFATVNYTLSADLEVLFLVEGAPGAINAAGNGLLNFLFGNSGNNALSGLGGDDVLVAGGGHDILIGGTGNDAMFGGDGNDTYYVDSESDTVAENLNEGIDLVRASVNWTLGANVENLILLAGAVNGAGNTGANVITANGDDNNISGKGGADTINAGGGNDKIYIPDSAFASVNGGAGFDWLALATNGQSFDLTANSAKITNIEVISLSSASAATLSLTRTDIPAINSGGRFLYVIGEADDGVSVDGVWTVIDTTSTNANLPGHTFFHYQSADDSTIDLYIENTMHPGITLLAVNSAPTVFLDGAPDFVDMPDGFDHSGSYTTGDLAGVAIADVVDASIDDPDTVDAGTVSAHIAQLDAVVSNPLSGAAEYLILTPAGLTIAAANGLTVTGELTDHLQITGAAADTIYQELLREIRYVNTEVGGALDTTDREITVTVSDGFDTSNTATATIAITAGNEQGGDTPPQLDLDTADGDYTADTGQPATFATTYASGDPEIPVASVASSYKPFPPVDGGVAVVDDGDAIVRLVVHLQVTGGGSLNPGEALDLGSYQTFLEGLGYSIGFDTSDPTDFVLIVDAPVGTPGTAAAFADIISNISYSNPVTDFAFVVDDRVLTFTLTDDGGNDTSGQLSLPVTTIDMAANVTDTGNLDVFTGGNLDDSITGLDGDDVIDGGDGSDFIDGGDGADTVQGGADDDTIYQLVEDDGDSIDGGSNGAFGDTLIFDADIPSNVAIDVGASGAVGTIGDAAFGSTAFTNIENLSIITYDGSDTVEVASDLASAGVQSLTLFTQDGGDVVDVSALSGGTTYIDPGLGSDTVHLGASSDTIHFRGLFGNDQISGFTPGTDVLVFDSLHDATFHVDIIDLGGGEFDLVAANSGGTLGQVHVVTSGGTLTSSDLQIV